MNTYHVVMYEAEEGGYWAEVMELPGCVAQGENLDELRKNAMDAIDVFLEAMSDQGEEPSRDRPIGTLEVAASVA